MAMVKEKGTYMGRPSSWGVDTEKAPRFVCKFDITAMRVGAEWVPCEAMITGFFNLIQNNSLPNEINCCSLSEAFGWTSGAISELDSGDWSAVEVQLVVDEHVYNGKTTMEIKYLNPKNYGGKPVAKADVGTVKSLDAKYGATLRALFGSKGVTTKHKAATTTAPPPSGKPAATVNPADGAKTEAWNALRERTPTYDMDRRTETFKKIARDNYPTTEPRDLTADQWAQVKDSIVNDFSEVTGELVPF